MAEQKTQTPKKKSGGKQQDKKKTDKKRRAKRDPLLSLRATKARRKHEVRIAERKLAKLLARSAAGKPGGIKMGSLRHQRMLEHITALKGILPTRQQKAESHRTRLIVAGVKVGRKLISLVNSGELKPGREARRMLQYALSLFAKARESKKTTNLIVSYLETVEKRGKAAEKRGKAAEKAANEGKEPPAPPAHEHRDYQVPKTLPPAKRNPKAEKAKNYGRLIREAKNFVEKLMADEGDKLSDDACFHLKEVLEQHTADLTRRAENVLRA